MSEHYPFPYRFDRDQYSELYLMRQVTEAQVQQDILALMRAFDVDAIPIDAGGRRQRGRMMGAAKKAGIDLANISNAKTWYSIPAGFADLEATLAPVGRSLYIEVKAPAWIDEKKKIIRRAGEPSQEQLDFLLEKLRRGACVLVAWSAKDVEEYIGSHLELNRRVLR